MKQKILEILLTVMITSLVIALIILLGIKSANRAETDNSLGRNFATEVKEICQTYGRDNGRMLYEIKKNGKVTKEELKSTFSNNKGVTILTMIDFTFDNEVSSEEVEQRYFDECLKNALIQINNK